MWKNCLSYDTLVNQISIFTVLFLSNAYGITTPKDFELKCLKNLTISGYYSEGYCYTREGPFNLKDTIKNNVCKLLPNGELMSEHSPQAFSNVSNNLVKKSSKEVEIYLENPITIGSTVTIEGQVTENCPVIGLTASEEHNSTNDWYWRSGFEQNWPASPTRTPWDTENGEPDNKDGEENDACIYWETMKLRDYPNYLRRYVIFEYDNNS